MRKVGGKARKLNFDKEGGRKATKLKGEKSGILADEFQVR